MHDGQAPFEALAISSSAGRQRSSRSMAMTRRAPAESSARVRPPGPGPISKDGAGVKRAGGASDLGGDVEVEQEILPEPAFGIDA